MKTKNDNLLKNLVLTPLYFLIFCSQNAVFKNAPLSCGFYAALLCSGEPIFLTSLAFVGGFSVFRSLKWFVFGGVFSTLLGTIFALYEKKRRRVGGEIIVYVLAGLIVYLWEDFPSSTIEKLVYTSIIAAICLISATAHFAVFYKKLNLNSSVKDGVTTASLFILTAVGFIKLFGIEVYRPLAIAIFLLFAKYYKNALSSLVALAVAVPLVIADGRYEYLAAFALFFIAFTTLKTAPSPVIFAGICLCELSCGFFFKFYGEYGYTEAIAALFCILLISLIPQKKINEIAEKYNFDPQKSLIKSSINKTRVDISSKLYDVSNVFFQMETAFKNLKKCAESTDVLVEKMTDEVLFNVCTNCQFKIRCQNKKKPKREVIEKILRIGIAKGRITIVDLPKEFTDDCGFPNSAIFEVNRLIGEYYEYVKAAEGGDKTKEILSLQSNGVGDVLKNLAFSLSKTVKENAREEKRVLKILASKGVKCEGAFCFGEGADAEIQLIIATRRHTADDVAKILSNAFKINLTVSRAETVANGITSLTLKIAPRFDAAFGVSKVLKSGSNASGDCHSLIKIDESNFLVALSDGMGSGEFAEKTSETALNLIESLYKAGLNSEFILNLVNKLLSVSIDDNFSAVDVALVNLKGGEASFIKIGAPYGFIVSETGIRFIEGSSLPLGILDDLHPSTSTAGLQSGEVIIMVSDGVTDAFSSSGDLIDFLKSAPIKNPQELADSLVQKALFLSNGVAEDDMTAVCVRLIDAA